MGTDKSLSEGDTGYSCESKKALIIAAQKLFSERGYDNVTIDQIAAECGFTKGAFYYSFKCKKDLLFEIDRLRLNILAHELDESSDTGLSRLRRYIGGWCSILASDSLNLTRQLFTHYLTGDLSRIDDEGNQRTPYSDDVRFISSYIEEAISSKELVEDTPVHRIASQIVYTLYGFAVSLCMENDEDPCEWGAAFANQTIEGLEAEYSVD